LSPDAGTGYDGGHLLQGRGKINRSILYRFPRRNQGELRETIQQVKPARIEVPGGIVAANLGSVAKPQPHNINRLYRADSGGSRLQ
jgi:hypothetical protein